jgi:hypothetical protein
LYSSQYIPRILSRTMEWARHVVRIDVRGIYLRGVHDRCGCAKSYKLVRIDVIRKRRRNSYANIFTRFVELSPRVELGVFSGMIYQVRVTFMQSCLTV